MAGTSAIRQPRQSSPVTVKLQKQGHKAFARSIASKEGKSTRVYIGPRLTKSAFDKDKKTIDKEFLVKSMVLRFDQ